MNKRDGMSRGFTIVEVLVTIFIATVFIIAIAVLYGLVVANTAAARNRADASDLAYQNLRTYAYSGATPASWSITFSCDNNSDYQSNPSAPGQLLDHGSLSSAQTTMPQPVNYQITAIAPFGCGGPPILVRSQVTYGPDNIKVEHESYVGY